MKTQRKCSKCKRRRPLVGFATFRGRDGTARRRGVCVECRDAYAQENFETLQEWRRKYNKKNRSKKQARDKRRRDEARAFVDAFKRRPCADCGGEFPPVAMDLDHVRGAKFKSVATLVGGAYRLELIQAELEKCEVVCACCHRVRTAQRKENAAPTLARVPRKSTGNRGSLRRKAS